MSKEKHMLNFVAREGTGKGSARRLRREGKIPAIVYSKGQVGEMITLDSGEWRSLMKNDVNLVHLCENGKEKCVALIKAVQENFLRGWVTHIDFQEVDMNETITAKVAIASTGDAIGETQGGMLEQVLHEVEVEATPANLPELIEIDISGIGVDESLCLKDVKVADGVKVIGEPSSVVFHVVKRASEASAEAAAEEAAE